MKLGTVAEARARVVTMFDGQHLRYGVKVGDVLVARAETPWQAEYVAQAINDVTCRPVR